MLRLFPNWALYGCWSLFLEVLLHRHIVFPDDDGNSSNLIVCVSRKPGEDRNTTAIGHLFVLSVQRNHQAYDKSQTSGSGKWRESKNHGD